MKLRSESYHTRGWLLLRTGYPTDPTRPTREPTVHLPNQSTNRPIRTHTAEQAPTKERDYARELLLNRPSPGMGRESLRATFHKFQVREFLELVSFRTIKGSQVCCRASGPLGVVWLRIGGCIWRSWSSDLLT